MRAHRLIGVYSDPGHDLRGHVVTLAYLAKEIGGELRTSSDVRKIKALKRIPSKPAFDHRKILSDALESTVAK